MVRRPQKAKGFRYKAVSHDLFVDWNNLGLGDRIIFLIDFSQFKRYEKESHEGPFKLAKGVERLRRKYKMVWNCLMSVVRSLLQI